MAKVLIPKILWIWTELLRVPAMRIYFDHMNLFHISFAAFPNDDDATSYIRGRRYMPAIGKGFDGTDLQPDYYPESRTISLLLREEMWF